MQPNENRDWKKGVVCEKIDLNFSIDNLKAHFLEEIKPRQLPYWQNTYNLKTGEIQVAGLHDPSIEKTFGGWALQSRDGDQKSAWVPAHLNYQQNWIDASHRHACFEDKEDDHATFTSLCTGPFLELLQVIERLGLEPRRARITCVPRQTFLDWHTDTDVPGVCLLRLHIPLFTNPDCFFESEDSRFFLPNDGGAFILNVNHFHRIANYGRSDRIHLIMTVRDTAGVTQHFSHNVVYGN